MYKTIIEDILFLDIETVPAESNYDNLEEDIQVLWEKKAQYLLKDGSTPKDVYQKAGIMAEFGKIVCVSTGFATMNNGKIDTFRLHSFYGDDEVALLKEIAELLQNHYNKPNRCLCAHNGKEFDFPWMARRMLINGINLPTALQISGKKPWEIQHLDTMELWKFGDYKHYTSLNLLAHIFNIPTPKDDIDGSQVADVYYKEKNLERIVTYCQKDVVTVAKIFLKLRNEPLFKDENITII